MVWGTSKQAKGQTFLQEYHVDLRLYMVKTGKMTVTDDTEFSLMTFTNLNITFSIHASLHSTICEFLILEIKAICSP